MVAGVVIPAHNEASVISRLLRALLDSGEGQGFEIAVVANGCDDNTVEVAESTSRQWADASPSRVIVLSTDDRSKTKALRIGDSALNTFPRVWVDADVIITAQDLAKLCSLLELPGVHAVAPTREVLTEHRPLTIRWYYEVWERLPAARTSLFGRGVVALSREGHLRVGNLPPVLSDDLAVAMAFEPAEVVIDPSSRVRIQAPRTTRDLMRRRTRVHTGSAQLSLRPDGPGDARPRNSSGDLARLMARPWLAPKVVVYLAIGTASRIWARRLVRKADFSTWLRDESTRDARRPGP